MKIAVFTDAFPKLSQTFVLNQITGLIDEGHEVDIIARAYSNETLHHEDIEKYKLLERVYYYGENQFIPQGKLRKFLTMLKIIWTYKGKHLNTMMRSLNFWKYGLQAIKLNTFFITTAFINSEIEKYDIILCHFGPIGALGAVLKDNGIIKGKLITVFHGFDITRYVRDKGIHVYKQLFKTGDMFLPISENWQRELIRLGCDPGKIVVHHMGIDTKKFIFKQRELNSDRTIQLLTIARLVEKKGVEYGIRAIAKIANIHPGIRYIIAGDGPLKNDLLELINQLGVQQQVELVGWKTQNEIIELMEKTDILVAPSVTAKSGDQEGIPVVLMEALAQGIPVVTTHHSGIPELVHDGVSGYLVPERDADALSMKVEELVKNPACWKQMGLAGRKFVKENYDIHKLNSHLIDIFSSLY